MSKDLSKYTVKEISEKLKEMKEMEASLLKALTSDKRKGVQTSLQKWKNRQDKIKLLIKEKNEMLTYEENYRSKGYTAIAGIDEVGRGPLAGPVVAAAVILPSDFSILGITDSKKLSLSKREYYYEEIYSKSGAIGIGIVEAELIDALNILEATRLAMQKAVDDLEISADMLLVDAMTLPVNTPQESILQGDAKSYSIAAASIVAKVTRDRIMEGYAKCYPQYGFENNVGYGTKDHLASLRKYGPSPIHRHSFAPVRKYTR